jgi:hypothetical protein
VGQPDFTACTLVTEPDRSYDICVDEVCVSPGCGDETCNVPAPHIPVTDTGQLTCYNDSIGVVNPCPVSGEEYYGQDGQYGWDLGHMTAERFTRDTTTLPENPLVTDALTGLTWQGCAGGLTDGSCITGAEEELLWTEAVAYCDDLDWAGRTDWRLPDIYELQSIIDMGELDPVIDQSIFPFTPSIGFWSSSSSAYVPSSSWYVDFTMGLVTYDEKANHFAARCVRGDPGTPLRFEPATLAGDRVVEDPLNGLTWQGCPAGLTGDACETGTLEERTWSEALEYCESLDWGGNTDWRMPNGNELFTMVKTRDYFPAIDLTIFPVTPADSYDTCEFWTSTTIRDGDADLNFDGAVTVIFSTGARENYNKTLTQCVRCVRGGLQ